MYVVCFRFYTFCVADWNVVVERSVNSRFPSRSQPSQGPITRVSPVEKIISSLFFAHHHPVRPSAWNHVVIVSSFLHAARNAQCDRFPQKRFAAPCVIHFWLSVPKHVINKCSFTAETFYYCEQRRVLKYRSSVCYVKIVVRLFYSLLRYGSIAVYSFRMLFRINIKNKNRNVRFFFMFFFWPTVKRVECAYYCADGEILK